MCIETVDFRNLSEDLQECMRKQEMVEMEVGNTFKDRIGLNWWLQEVMESLFCIVFL